MRIELRAYGPLNHFLAPNARHVARAFVLDAATTAKDFVESAGIPHVEIDLMLVNGVAVGFQHLLADGDRIAVFPRFFSFEPAPDGAIKRSAEPARFVLDVHLGRLARHMRLAGLDTSYASDASDETLAALAAADDRILLTRDVGLLKRRAVEHGYWVRSTSPRDQLVEVLQRFDRLPLAPFTRCLRCNGVLHAVDKTAIVDRLPPRVRERDDSFSRCAACGQIYWKGTHYERLAAALEAAIDEAGSGRRS